MDNVKNVNIEEMEQVTGGFIYLNDKGLYEVIDENNNGSVAATFKSRDEAVAYCNEHGLKTLRITWENVDMLRHPGRPVIDRTITRRPRNT